MAHFSASHTELIKGPRAVNRIAPLIYSRLVRLPRFLRMSERHESIAEKILRSRPVGRELRSAVCGFGEACMQQCLGRANSILITESLTQHQLSQGKVHPISHKDRGRRLLLRDRRQRSCEPLRCFIQCIDRGGVRVEAGKFHKRCSKTVLQRLILGRLLEGCAKYLNSGNSGLMAAAAGYGFKERAPELGGRNDHRLVLKLGG